MKTKTVDIDPDKVEVIITDTCYDTNKTKIVAAKGRIGLMYRDDIKRLKESTHLRVKLDGNAVFRSIPSWKIKLNQPSRP